MTRLPKAPPAVRRGLGSGKPTDLLLEVAEGWDGRAGAVAFGPGRKGGENGTEGCGGGGGGGCGSGGGASAGLLRAPSMTPSLESGRRAEVEGAPSSAAHGGGLSPGRVERGARRWRFWSADDAHEVTDEDFEATLGGAGDGGGSSASDGSEDEDEDTKAGGCSAAGAVEMPEGGSSARGGVRGGASGLLAELNAEASDEARGGGGGSGGGDGHRPAIGRTGGVAGGQRAGTEVPLVAPATAAAATGSPGAAVAGLVAALARAVRRRAAVHEAHADVFEAALTQVRRRKPLPQAPPLPS